MKLLLILLISTCLYSKNIHKEKEYQKLFCEAANGQIEYVLSDKTRVDCLTKKYAVEVDFGRKAFESIGQSLHYAMMTNKKPAILLIIENKKDKRYAKRIKPLAKRYNIKLVELSVEEFERELKKLERDRNKKIKTAK